MQTCGWTGKVMFETTDGTSWINLNKKSCFRVVTLDRDHILLTSLGIVLYSDFIASILLIACHWATSIMKSCQEDHRVTGVPGTPICKYMQVQRNYRKYKFYVWLCQVILKHWKMCRNRIVLLVSILITFIF